MRAVAAASEPEVLITRGGRPVMLATRGPGGTTLVAQAPATAATATAAALEKASEVLALHSVSSPVEAAAQE